MSRIFLAFFFKSIIAVHNLFLAFQSIPFMAFKGCTFLPFCRREWLSHNLLVCLAKLLTSGPTSTLTFPQTQIVLSCCRSSAFKLQIFPASAVVAVIIVEILQKFMFTDLIFSSKTIAQNF